MTSFVRWFVFAFGLLLVLAALPLVGGAPMGSGAPAYSWFHLVGAVVALALVFVNKGRGAAWFALVFGLIDLYQLLASSAGWFPIQLFQWTTTDDLAHIVWGLILTSLGGMALTEQSQ